MSQATSFNSSSDTGTGGVPSFFQKLHQIKIGGGGKVRRGELAFLLSNLSTLLENGVSLAKALATLSRERALKKHAPMIEAIRSKLESGESFSSALAAFPGTFSELMVSQVRVGERSGTVAETLSRICSQLESASELRSKVLKRLSYPLIVIAAGSGVVSFMLLYVVPVFEKTYRDANIPLPGSTKLLIDIGYVATHYGWMVLLAGIAAMFIYARLRKNPEMALRLDRMALRVPLLGDWFRDGAVLQFVEVLGTMLDSGFKLVDALAVSANSVGNRAVRSSVNDLREAIIRGERLSRELEKHADTYPPIVSQLVIVGEQTGNLPRAAGYIRDHLRKDIERRADRLVATIEPVLTIGMAVAIGAILLAIYMPMFGMIDTVE